MSEPKNFFFSEDGELGVFLYDGEDKVKVEITLSKGPVLRAELSVEDIQVLGRFFNSYNKT